MRDKYGVKYEWLPCEICGTYRYVQIVKGKPRYSMCKHCADELRNNKPIWFSPNTINYNLLQMQYFLLPNLILLEMGDYPSEPREYKTWKWGGWVVCSGSSYIGGRTTYRNPNGREITGLDHGKEIRIRIDLIERYPVRLETHTEYVDGILLERKFTWNEEFKDNILHYEADKMLSFVSGWERKRTTFLKWRS